MKKVKEMDPSPYVYSENTLLAEMSFMSKQNTQSVPNGYLQWTENMDKNMSPSQEVHTKVGSCESWQGFCKYLDCLCFVLYAIYFSVLLHCR